MAAITAADLQEHLGIDVVDAQISNNLDRAVNGACRWLHGAIGEYDEEDPRVIELALIVAADLYDNRNLNGAPGATIRKLVRDFNLQLRVEGAKE